MPIQAMNRKQGIIKVYRLTFNVLARYPEIPASVSDRFRAVRLETVIEKDLFLAIKNYVKAAQIVIASFPKPDSLAHRLGQEVLKHVETKAPALYYQATIEIELDHLRAKAIDLAQRHHPVAARALDGLVQKMEYQNKLFFQKQILTHKQYAENCLKHLREAPTVLKQHRGFLGWLDKLVFTLRYIASNSMEEAKRLLDNLYWDGYFVFTTKTTQRLEKLTEALNARSFLKPSTPTIR